MDEDVIAIIATFLIVFVPVAGITARIAVKPIVEALTRYMQARQGTEALQMVERRMALLEQELQSVRSDVQHMSEERDFFRQLAESSGGKALEAGPAS
ncbi:MAG TPA: hypothetical protein VEW03_08345 [Longimicrobiaceae bacterium]|nr:hypothetical protein [Longimicrobiaceae bacterium]